VDDVAGMAGSVVRILEDVKAARALGEAGRRRVSEHFSVQASAERLTGLYRECAGVR
jgi:glycosyltransferase involved in cell wall biosynthesis